ncbi:MAG: hypothetical protein WC346_03485 [Methanogenium sp.]|jgi:nicotinamide mononucleotide adenylyltransferase
MENIFRWVDVSKYSKLKKQIDSRKIGFFPGKFNPPHMGHFLTIMRLSKKYNIIVGLTEDRPKNSFSKKVILKTLMELEEYGIKIIELKGKLVEKKDLSGLPKFDVLLSGNLEVIKWAKKMKIRHEFVKRSSEISARQIRNGT